MNEVYSRVFLGGIEDACKGEILHEAGVTHVLTLDSRPLSRCVHNGFSFVYKFVHILDLESSDMLTSFGECLRFIEEGRQAGGVLVHCHVGQSRSATIVLAYMMQKLKITLQQALAQVTKIRPQIRPNAGFLSQLQLFENMGSKIDPENPEYKMYRLNLLALRMQTDQVENYLSEGTLISDPKNSTEFTGVVYKCRKCRRPLFRKSGLLSHTRGCGEAAFDWRNGRSSGDQRKEEVCTQSLFLEPVQWMRDSIMCLSGKLSCPKCQAKLGSFNWAGEPCPCGTWMTPAFHIQKSKVDECRSTAAVVQTKQAGGAPLQQTVVPEDGQTLPSMG